MSLVGVAATLPACTQKAADEATSTTSVAIDTTKQGSDRALDATREGSAKAIEETREASEKAEDEGRNLAQRTGDKTKEIAEKTADKTKEIAGAVAGKTKDAVSTTGEVITDGWITTKVSTKFVDETLLKGSDIDVDTDNHVVTLKGTVRSEAAKTRAAVIASGTEGVTRVINQIAVRPAA